jgi:2-dehydro-3-deoxyphosphogluconate aldolase/(4S)-4-hydroxy-2-oxoglutarate aldolase
MARFDRMTVLQTILDDGMVPLFYHADSDTAQKVAAALAQGGARVLEFTNRGDYALQVFSALTKHAAQAFPEMVIGVGTVDDAPTAALFLQHGANFVVGPSFNEEVARLCNRRKVAYLPGCLTLAEIARAEEFGVEIVKLFPGEVGGPGFVKAVQGPRPWTRIMPTGGVSPDETNLRAWFEAGVAAVGMGSQLVRADWIKAGDYAAITEKTRVALKLIGDIRRK